MSNLDHDVLVTLTSNIVSAHVGANTVTPEDVPVLIANVFEALAGLGSKFLLGEPPSTCGRSASGQDVVQNWKPLRSSGEWLFSSELNPAIYVRN